MSIRQSTDISLEVLDAEVVVQQLLKWEIVLALQAGSVLGYVEGWAAISITQPLDQFSEAQRHWPEPERLCLWTNPFAILVLLKALEISQKVVEFGLSVLVLDIVGTVVVHTIEVIAAFDKSRIFWSELWKSVPELLPHRIWVFAKVDWVSEPADGELKLSVACLDILRVIWIPWFGPVTWLIVSLAAILHERLTAAAAEASTLRVSEIRGSPEMLTV